MDEPLNRCCSRLNPFAGVTFQTMTSRCASLYGSGLRITALMMEKTAVETPIASAIVAIASSAIRGFAHHFRRAYRMANGQLKREVYCKAQTLNRNGRKRRRSDELDARRGGSPVIELGEYRRIELVQLHDARVFAH